MVDMADTAPLRLEGRQDDPVVALAEAFVCAILARKEDWTAGVDEVERDAVEHVRHTLRSAWSSGLTTHDGAELHLTTRGLKKASSAMDLRSGPLGA